MLAIFPTFTHDFLEPYPHAPNSPTQYYRLAEPDEIDYATGSVFKSDLKFIGGLMARVRRWKLSGSFALEDGTSGQILLFLDAMFAGDVAIEEEGDLCQFAHWGGAETHTVTSSAGNSNHLLRVRFGEAIFWDDSGVTVMGRPPLLPPFMDFLAGGDWSSLSFGGSPVLGDGCPVLAALPPTGHGFLPAVHGFDGTGAEGFTLQLGGQIYLGEPTGPTYNPVTGQLLLEPVRYWAYDPDDGGGPIYDEETGAWLRDPRHPALRGF